MNIKQMLSEIKTQKKLTKNKIKVGVLKDEIIEFLEKRDIEIYTKEIYLTHKGLSHLARESKKKRGAGLSEEDILKIPEILEMPSVIAVEKKKNKLHLLYCKDKEKCDTMIKIVVDTQHIEKGEILTIIKTAGYVKRYNIFNVKEYEFI